MSMTENVIHETEAFYVDGKVAALIHSKIMNSPIAPNSEYDIIDLFEELEHNPLEGIDIVPLCNFDGTIITQFPQRTEHPINIKCDDDRIGIILSSYSNCDDAIAEFKEIFKNILPKSFDYWANLVVVIGTTFG